MQKTFLLEVSDLSYNVNRRTILQHVSFTLSPGQVVGLVGVNGAGKSTTLNLLGGLLSPTSGQLFLEGVDLNEFPLIRQQRVGFLPDPLPFYPELTVNEYLQFNAEIRCINGPRIPQRIASVTDYLDLKSFAKQTMTSLSKGQRQRVGLAQALLHQPRLLLLDEPTNGLDPIQKVNFLARIKHLGQSITIFMSSHDLDEVQAVCDRVLLLHNGALTEQSVAGVAQVFQGFSKVVVAKGLDSKMVNTDVMDAG